MLKKILLIALSSLMILYFTSCKDDNEPKKLKIGLVSGLGSLADRGFNQQAVEGLTNVALETGSEYEVRESASIAEIESNIAHFCDQKFDVIIAMTYDAAQPAYDAAIAHPGVKFILLDNSFNDVPANLVCITFQVDQVSFMAGFLAAWWTWKKNPAGPKAAFVAGPDIPQIRQFTQSYAAGVDYFNTRYSLNVEASGANAGNFNDTLQGAHLADSLIQSGADLVFACAGKTGNGALFQAKTSGIQAIGVDTDQYLTIPEVGDILLTSCMKRLDISIYDEIRAIIGNQFHGGSTIISNLTGNGVQLAPFHNFENQIPDSIKTVLGEIRQGIINGTVNTGWK